MKSTPQVRITIWGMASGLLFFALGCKTAPSSKSREERPAPTATAKGESGFDLNLNCVIDSIQNPTEAFHYTYKKDTSDNNLIQEADITPDTINGSSKDKYATREVKGVKSDRQIDTSRGNAAEAGLYKATLGDGGFEKGTVWVNAKGCPVKLSLDSEMHLNNGTVEKLHYEIQMVKK